MTDQLDEANVDRGPARPKEVAEEPDEDTTASEAAPVAADDPASRRQRRALANYMETAALELESLAHEAEARTTLAQMWATAGGIRGRIRQTPKIALGILAIVAYRLSRLMARHAKREYAAVMKGPPRSALLFERSVQRARSGEEHRRSAIASYEAAAATGRWEGPVVTVLMGGAIWAGLIATNYFVFRAFDTDYFGWFLDNGALITAVFAFVSLAISLDRYPAFVSANPITFLVATFTLFELVYTSWRLVIEGGPSDEGRSWIGAVGDMLLALVFMVAVSVAVLGWMLVIAPLQYLFTLACGAPARLALRSPRTSWYDPESDEAEIDAPRGAASPKSALVVGYAEKPVALTAAVQVALLWIVNQWR